MCGFEENGFHLERRVREKDVVRKGEEIREK